MAPSSFAFDWPKAFIFDFDGTLASLNVDFRAMRTGVLDRIQARGLSPEPFEGLFALEMIASAEQVLSRSHPGSARHFREDALEFIRTVERDGAREGRVLEGVPELLLQLRSMNIATAVVTRNCRDAVLAIYPDITDHVDLVLTRDDVSRVKPHPGHIAAALEGLGKEPGDALMVGDHPMDIAAGKAAGTRTAGVLTGLSSRDVLEASGCDHVFQQVTDLLPRNNSY